MSNQNPDTTIITSGPLEWFIFDDQDGELRPEMRAYSESEARKVFDRIRKRDQEGDRVLVVLQKGERDQILQARCAV